MSNDKIPWWCWVVFFGSNIVGYLITVLLARRAIKSAAIQLADDKRTLLETQTAAIEHAHETGAIEGRAQLQAEINAQTPSELLAMLQAINQSGIIDVRDHPTVLALVAPALNSKRADLFKEFVIAFRRNNISFGKEEALARQWELVLKAYQL